jgi:predicted anti-sigma-YlaC factor YlaD
MREDRRRQPLRGCSEVREAASAAHDGEAGGPPATVVAEHLATCAPCRAFEADLGTVARRVRLVEATVPDLTSSILAAADTARLLAPDRRRRELRLLVALAGLVQLALAVPALVGATVGDPHLLREAGALQLAVAVGLLVAAWQPRRAAGVLPIAAVVVAATVVGAVVDVRSGATTLAAELAHLPELVGFVALWSLSRRGDRSGGASRTRRPPARRARVTPAATAG